ncbi:MAG: pyruvate dehydrogenase complex dihydrolipoamide acetyltransferase [Candidatus Liberibacter ctenarytainae]|uniref:Acetyltransferase component of pyruvate dehydrogenase complex n=1 Tax=Candidatus Liberibacter ctenarytainae TaxID=2020335 RepID=A0A937AKQ6_9HYPH|nr:pyruvate dehydrogenase complex dihydrolipoamide acetyltransferase [Candidatus Liberibacter ctenarytainae]
MMHTITMPALSPTMEEGKLAKWLIKKGDKISPGDIICEIETDKAIMEFEAVDEGIAHEILVPEGTENIKIHTPILTFIADFTENITIPGLAESNPIKKNIPHSAASSPLPVEEDQEKSLQTRKYPASSPLARRLAKEKGIDLSSISGSGPYGRIVKKDIQNLDATHMKKSTFPAVQSATIENDSAFADADVMQLFEKNSYEIVPHDNMRRTIAHRLQQSKQTIPHFYVSIDCSIDNLLSLREQMNTQILSHNKEGTFNKISVNDIILKAFSLAMMQVPEANVSWTKNALLYHKNVDISVAVSIPGGIVTPIIRKVDQKSIHDISSEAKQLIQRAKQRKLKPEEYQGGTTSISNMGMFGVKSFSAIINPPQSTILSVGAGETKPVFRDGKIITATLMNVTLSADHRTVDGAVASQLLSQFKKYVENPVWMIM